MNSESILVIGGIVLLGIFFLVVRLAVRWIIRIAILGLILIALLGGGIFWWWTNRLTSKPQQKRSLSAPARRASSI